MNSESREQCETYAKQSGAIVRCPRCRSYDIKAGDEDADRKAYATATNAWKAGKFGLSDLNEVSALMKSVLTDANHECPSCR